MKFKSEVQLEALNNATTDTDKFLVSDSSTVKYRTGAQVLSDIGASPSSGSTSYIQNQNSSVQSASMWINGTATINGGWATTILDGDNVVVRKPNYPSGGWARTLLNFQEYTGTSLYQIGALGSGNTFTYGYLGSAYNTPTITWYEDKKVVFYGNVLINTTTDAGYKLDVNGTGRFTSTIAASNFSGTHSGTSSGTNTGDNPGVTSVAALTLGTAGTDLNSTVANGTGAAVITLNVPDASATARGVITTGTQTFAGDKFFGGDIATDSDVTISGGGSLIYNQGTFSIGINSATLTANRGIDFPDASGVVALTSNLTGYLTIANPTFTGTLIGPAATITTVTGALSGNATTATTLQTARTLTIGSTGKTFNGSANVGWTLAEIGAAPATGGSYLPLVGGTLTGALNGTSAGFTQGVYNNINGLRLLNPGGGSYVVQSSTVTGAIKITLPVSWTDTMMRMTIKVYEYTTNESFTIICGGYTYSGNPTWVNTFAYIESSAKNDRNFTVRFGHDGTKCCVYIGELASSWSYPQVFVTEFEAGYNIYTASTWNNGWGVGFEASAFGTITRTETNTQVNNWARNGQDTYYGSGTGNVGIGMTTPGDKLEVNGNVYANAFNSIGTISRYNSTGGLAMYGLSGNPYAVIQAYSNVAGAGKYLSLNPNGGNVGIGTTTPGAKLDVAGDALINSITVGRGSGNVSNNTANGYTSLYSNTTGNQNTANGYEALRFNTIGYRNTAFGYQTLRTNVDDNGLTAIGYSALYSNNGGGLNTAVGYQALYSNTVANENTAVGSSTLGLTVGGGRNTAVGSAAMLTNIVGSNNLAIGTDALRNATANSNTAVGSYSLRTNVGGSNNVAVGKDSGAFLSNGTTAVTTTTNSVFIGSGTSPLANSQTNQIVIGYLATGAGSNSVVIGNDSITKTLLKGNVGIGTTSPNSKLDVYTATTGGNIRLSSDTPTTYGEIRFSSNNASYLGYGSSIEGTGEGVGVNVGDLRFKTGSGATPTTRMRIASSGNVLIGTTTDAGTDKLQVAGSILASTGGIKIGSTTTSIASDGASLYLKAGSNTYFNTNNSAYVSNAGVMTAANFVLSSDERKKTKIKDLSRDNINVSWKTFEMKNEEGEYRVGVIAQELEIEHPEFVRTDKDGFKSVAYIDLLIAKIAELEARLEKAGI
tara:strand:- start:111 stop:3602 length:3492 start_codon:yes stop_codon:yes gene_type:complete